MALSETRCRAGRRRQQASTRDPGPEYEELDVKQTPQALIPTTPNHHASGFSMPCLIFTFLALYVPCHNIPLMPPDHASHINHHANSSYDPRHLSVLDLGGVWAV